jgi:hypothetical protein
MTQNKNPKKAEINKELYVEVSGRIGKKGQLTSVKAKLPVSFLREIVGSINALTQENQNLKETVKGKDAVIGMLEMGNGNLRCANAYLATSNSIMQSQIQQITYPQLTANTPKKIRKIDAYSIEE